MPSIASRSASRGAAGASTRTSTPAAPSATARRRMKAPATSPLNRGNECVMKRTRTYAGVPVRSARGRRALVVEQPPQLALLGAQYRDLLAEQAGREEYGAEDQARLDDRPHRPHGEQSVVRRDHDQVRHSGDESEPEQSRAEHAEREQRLAPEAQLEPDGEHVEHADRNARDAELRLPRVARI